MPHLPFDLRSMQEKIYRKTIDSIRLSWNNYKESDKKFLRGEEIKQKSMHEHFLRDGNQSFEENVSICLTDKTDRSGQHKREAYWMRTLKTIEPFGFNTKKHTEQYIPLRVFHPPLYYSRK